MKKLLIASLIVLFTGCSKDPQSIQEYEMSGPKWTDIEILDINPPKHFSVTYKIVSTGEVVKTSSKRCSDWHRIKVGGIYTANINESGCSLVRSIP